MGFKTQPDEYAYTDAGLDFHLSILANVWMGHDFLVKLF